MADESETNNGAVGYRRPPKASQFKKGQSGNPRGRPPRSPGRRATAERVLGETQRLAGLPKGARVRFKTLEVIVMTLKQMTAAGNAKAVLLYTRFVERYGRQETPLYDVGYLVMPEPLTEDEWRARYEPKEVPPSWGDEPE